MQLEGGVTKINKKKGKYIRVWVCLKGMLYENTFKEK